MEERFLDINEVMARTGIRRTKIYELEKAGRFPKRMKPSTHSRVVWPASEITAWIEETIKNTPRIDLQKAS